MAALIAPRFLGRAVCLSIMASQFPALAVSSIAFNRVQQNADLSGCNTTAVAALINQLSQPNSSSAFNSLVQCGEPATQLLISVLNDSRKDSLTRRLAARALSQIGSPEAIAALLSTAQQPSEIRDSALRAIADINPQARAAVPVLLTATISQDAEVMAARANALRRIDPAAPVRAIITAFWEATSNPNTDRYRASTALLDQLRTSNFNLTDLTQALQNRDAVIRAIAAYLLLQEGRNAQAAIPQLTTALLDESPLVRDTAACALGRIGTREAITVLITQLRTGNEATQASAAIGLSSLTAEARESLPVLIAALRNDNDQVRSMAAYALGQMERDARRAIPALLGRLSDRSASVRATAAYALGQITPDDPRVIRLLVRQAASDTDPTVQDSATESLRQATPEATATLLEIFANPNQPEAESAAQLLLNLGSTVDPYLTAEDLPKILQGISHVPWRDWESSRRMQFANYALQHFGSSIVPTLIASLNNPNEDIRVGATSALLIGHSEQYFDRQSIEPAIPILTQTFRNSRLYTLWKSENQALMMAALHGDQRAYSQVEEIVFGDRVGLSALGFLLWSDGLFLDVLQRENRTTTDLVEHLAFSRIVAGGVVLVPEVEARSERPAICRVAFMQRFLWRCR
jgi:HEAT repeat protein